ncbi:hypothetical protein ES703_20541 [subsurface metagenome]
MKQSRALTILHLFSSQVLISDAPSLLYGLIIIMPNSRLRAVMRAQRVFTDNI